MSGLEGSGSGVAEAAWGSGLGLTSSSSAYVRLSSCTRGWRREGKEKRNETLDNVIEEKTACTAVLTYVTASGWSPLLNARPSRPQLNLMQEQ